MGFLHLLGPNVCSGQKASPSSCQLSRFRTLMSPQGALSGCRGAGWLPQPCSRGGYAVEMAGSAGSSSRQSSAERCLAHKSFSIFLKLCSFWFGILFPPCCGKMSGGASGLICRFLWKTLCLREDGRGIVCTPLVPTFLPRPSVTMCFPDVDQWDKLGGVGSECL